MLYKHTYGGRRAGLCDLYKLRESVYNLIARKLNIISKYDVKQSVINTLVRDFIKFRLDNLFHNLRSSVHWIKKQTAIGGMQIGKIYC